MKLFTEIKKKTVLLLSFTNGRILSLVLLFIFSYSFGTCVAFIHEYASAHADQSVILSRSDTSWGLSFQEEGAVPVGNATIEELASYDAYYAQDTSDKILYLTFDTGYENGNTEKILDILKKHETPAAFFVVGTYIDAEPELVRRMHEEGHIVGNHTWRHPDMAEISTVESFRKELEYVEDAFYTTTGSEMTKFYRPPQGRYSIDNLEMAKSLGYQTFFWSLAYVDWYEDRQPSKEEAFDKLIGRIHPGAVVLLHSTSDTNASILDELLTRWEDMGYRIRPLTELTGSGDNS